MDADSLFQRRRRSGWRERVQAGLEAISEPLATGLLIHFNKRKSVSDGYAALQTLSKTQRLKAWKVVFPGMVEEVEEAWHQLAPEMIAQRDGGTDGSGDLYRWKLSEQQASHFFFEWFRKLTIAVGPFPELNFAQALSEAELLSSGRAEESDGDFFDTTTGHFYDSDALGYLASVVLNPGSRCSSAPEVESIVRGKISVTTPRHIKTACLCADRPDLWEALNTTIIEAQPDQQFEIWRDRLGGHTGALVGLLKTILSHNLAMNESVRYFLSSWQAVKLGWSRMSAANFNRWLERWMMLLESDDARRAAWQGREALDQLNSLWAAAVHDADQVLSVIARPGQLTASQRLAAVHFLQSCPGKRRAAAAVEYATDPDHLVASKGLSLLVEPGRALPTSGEVPDFFQRILQCPLLTVDSVREIARVLPFPKAKASKNEVLELLAERFPDGAEGKIEALLPQMKKEVRDSVVSRLNRYSLTQFDEEIARITHGDDPVIWADWLSDHEGSQEMAQRHLLFKMMGDRSLEVAEHAFKAVKKFSLTSEEFPLIRPLLKSRSAKRHLFVTRLISAMATMPGQEVVALLLEGPHLNERLCGLEVLRVWNEQDQRKDIAEKIWEKADQSQFTTEDELRAIKLFDSDSGIKDQSENTLATAFGLVSLNELPPVEEAKPHEVIIFSKTTETIVAALADWLTDHQGSEIKNPGGWEAGAPGMLPLTRGELPYYSPSRQMADFPVAQKLKNWWDSRPASMRDPDGMELVRLKIAAKNEMLNHSRMNDVGMMALFGRDSPFSHPVDGRDLTKLVDWLAAHFPNHLDEARYCFKAAQTVFLQLPPKQRNWSHLLYRVAQQFIYESPNADPKLTAAFLSWARYSPTRDYRPKLMIHEIVRFFRHGFVKPAELIWEVVGERDIEGYSRDRAFNDLASLTSPTHRNPDIKAGEVQEVVQLIVQRIVDLELERGGEPEPSSLAALSIKEMYGSKNLAACLEALGKSPLKLHTSVTEVRPAVLNHLISVSHPAQDDTAGTFAKAISLRKISTSRLIQLAALRPQWCEWIGAFLGKPGLKDAVAWVSAHARTVDYVWNANARALWEGDLASVSELSADQLFAGTVDIKWFQRCHRSLGADDWARVIAASKFISTGRGHARVHLFSQALTGETSASDLKKAIQDDRTNHAILALGLAPLPKATKKREKDILNRYRCLQDFRKLAAKSKPQKRKTQIELYEAGVLNLMHNANLDDPIRFRWKMETLACEELADLERKVGDATIAIQFSSQGKPSLGVTKQDRILKSIPATLRKDPALKELQARAKDLATQTKLMVEDLENMMISQTELLGSEWLELQKHPALREMLAALIFENPSRKTLLFLNDHDTGEDEPLKIAHPLATSSLPDWKHLSDELKTTKIEQPFAQIDRKIFTRLQFSGVQISTRYHLRSMGLRHWIYAPHAGLTRVFHDFKLQATIQIAEDLDFWGQYGTVTLEGLYFHDTREITMVPIGKINPILLSEVFRDLKQLLEKATP